MSARIMLTLKKHITVFCEKSVMEFCGKTGWFDGQLVTDVPIRTSLVCEFHRECPTFVGFEAISAITCRSAVVEGHHNMRMCNF